MDSHAIRCFQRFFEKKSIHQAAKDLCMTPQGVSRVISALEGEMQTALFIRSRKGMEATSEGRYFYEHTQELTRQLLDLQLGMQALKRKKAGLHIGFSCGVLNILSIHFVLEYGGLYKAVIGYKKAAGSGKVAFKVERYYQTEWMAESEMSLHLDGLNMDAIYENFIRQIAGDALQTVTPQEPLAESVARDEYREKLKKQIAKLQAKIRKEKQLNRQMKMNAELKKLKKEWEEISICN